MKIIVTGGRGFIGSHLVDQLIKEGHDVICYDKAKLNENQIPLNPKCKYIIADILDFKKLLECSKDADVIYHLAAVSGVKEAYEDPKECISINGQGTLNILEAARQNNLQRVIFASSIWIYSGMDYSTVDETSLLHIPLADHIYTSSKISGELYCHNYNKLYGQEFTILRYGIPYGPRARLNTLIPIFSTNALNGKPLIIKGDGTQFRKFLHVKDLVKANILALDKKAINKTYNITGNDPITVKDVANTVKDILGDVEIKYAKAREGDFKGKVISSQKIRSELKWNPDIEFEDGMKEYIEWLKCYQ